VTAAVRATGTGSSGSVTSTSFSPAMPSGFQAGDLLIGIASAGNSTAPSTRPSGSTLILNFVDGTVWSMDVVRKVAVGGDTFTWTIGTARTWAGCVIAIRGGTYDPITPIVGAAGLAIGSSVVLNVPTPSATPTSDDSLLIAAFGIQGNGTWSNSNTSPSMTEICDVAATATPAANCGVYRSNTPPAVAAISRTSASTISSANGGGFIMFVNPAPPGVQWNQRSPRPMEQVNNVAGPYAPPMSVSQVF